MDGWVGGVTYGKEDGGINARLHQRNKAASEGRRYEF